jgi:hypothetical protein
MLQVGKKRILPESGRRSGPQTIPIFRVSSPDSCISSLSATALAVHTYSSDHAAPIALHPDATQEQILSIDA